MSQSAKPEGGPALSRGMLLKAAGGLALPFLLPTGLVSAEPIPRNPIAFNPVSPGELPFVRAMPGFTTVRELDQIPLKKEHMWGTRFKLSTSSAVIARPHIMVTLNDKVEFIRRMVLGSGAKLSIDDYISTFGEAEAVLPAPMNEKFYSALDFETRVWPSQGFAVVINRNPTSGLEPYEVHRFTRGISLDHYNTIWGEGDHGLNFDRRRPGGLLLMSGLTDALNDETTPLTTTFKGVADNLLRYYPFVGCFSPRGGEAIKRPGQLAEWKPNPYNPLDTLGSTFDFADVLKDTVDMLRDYQPLDVLCFSDGGLIFRQYAIKYIVPEKGTHRYGKIGKAAFIDSPLGGINYRGLTALIPGIEAIQHLAALDNNSGFTKQVNEQLANFLVEKRGIGIITVTNTDDCFAPRSKAVIEGFGRDLPLGRGSDGIANCDDWLALAGAALSPEKLGSRVGHTQMLDDPGRLVERFLKSAQLRPFLGE